MNYKEKSNYKNKLKHQEQLDNIVLALFRSKTLGLVISLIQLVISVVFLAYVADFGLLPGKYFAILAAVLLVLFLVPFIMQLVRKLPGLFKVVSLIVSVALIFVHLSYIKPTGDLLYDMGNTNTQTKVMALYVLADDKAEAVSDMNGYVLGLISGNDKEASDKYIAELENKSSHIFERKEYTNFFEAVEALFDGSINALVLNTAYVELITDSEMVSDLDEELKAKFLAFETLTKVITKTHYEEVIKPSEEDNNNDDEPYVRPVVTDEPFCMYISGIDTAGSVMKTSRSDVNILAFVNPKTKQVLLVSTPRDSYVVNPNSNGIRDKLTHAGIYGIDSSMGALKRIYDIDIDFFFKVNFTGFTNIIDALGGVTVDSPIAFSNGKYDFVKGPNEMDGAKALIFCRDRYAFADGDRQRGRNQMAVISAVVKKMASSKLLTNYSDILASLNGTFQTSLTSDEISSLIKMQLDDMSSWNIQSYSADGKGSMEYTYTSPNGLRSVIILDQTTIDKAKVLIEQVYSGKTIDLSVVS